MKRQSRNVLFDRLHRGVVYTCMGLTLYGTYMLGTRHWTTDSLFVSQQCEVIFDEVIDSSHKGY
uniref:Uncharacterized protein n=1 Tax=Anopheles epiroticus TaxID=199890 RepID=A0A182P742_9DIPT